jgi:hypothetical protein
MTKAKPKASDKAAVEKETKLVTAMRNFIVTTVHKNGKWQKVDGKPVMGVKKHHGLDILYYTPFQKRRSPDNAGKQLGYQLEVRSGTAMVLCLMWNIGGPIYVETHLIGPWDKDLVSPIKAKAKKLAA